MTLLELKYIITSARDAAAAAKGMVELRSIVFYSREERRRWRQGLRVLEMLEDKEDGWFGAWGRLPQDQVDEARVSPSKLHGGTVDGSKEKSERI